MISNKTREGKKPEWVEMFHISFERIGRKTKYLHYQGHENVRIWKVPQI